MDVVAPANAVNHDVIEKAARDNHPELDEKIARDQRPERLVFEGETDRLGKARLLLGLMLSAFSATKDRRACCCQDDPGKDPTHVVNTLAAPGNIGVRYLGLFSFDSFTCYLYDQKSPFTKAGSKIQGEVRLIGRFTEYLRRIAPVAEVALWQAQASEFRA